MENKYFTPDIEDFYVGYEFYFNNELEIFSTFSKFTFDDVDDLINCSQVQYLTKEQIEAEGWKHTGGKLLSFAEQHYVKSTYRVSYSIDSKKIKFFISDPDEIINYEDECIFNGECKDINTFRKIIKLLGI